MFPSPRSRHLRPVACNQEREHRRNEEVVTAFPAARKPFLRHASDLQASDFTKFAGSGASWGGARAIDQPSAVRLVPGLSLEQLRQDCDSQQQVWV